MKIDHTEITVRLMNEDFTAKYLQENAELIQATIEATTKALNMPCVVQSLPKQFSGQAYRKAHQVMNYEEFVAWWDSV